MVRLEWVLELLQERRNAHAHRLHGRNDPRLSAAQPELVFSDRDMQEIMNDWNRVPEMWMHPDSLSRFGGPLGLEETRFREKPVWRHEIPAPGEPGLS